MISFQPLNPSDKNQTDHLATMILAFYSEYETDIPMTETKIHLSIRHFAKHPEAGRIILIYSNEHIAGYAILVNFWSNEYGGTVLFTDELYIKEAYRNAGIGKSFFVSIEEQFKDVKVFALEVSPLNKGAARLYESLGFRRNKNATLFKIVAG